MTKSHFAGGICSPNVGLRMVIRRNRKIMNDQEKLAEIRRCLSDINWWMRCTAEDMAFATEEVFESNGELPDPSACVASNSFEEFLFRFWTETEILKHRSDHLAPARDLTAYELEYRRCLLKE